MNQTRATDAVDIRDVAQILARDAEGICRHLLPNGKRVGNEWLVGSIGGETGKSLKVVLAGDKVGRWADFAADQKGDLVTLWSLCRGLSMFDAFQDAKKWKGIEDPTFHGQHRKKYRKPTRPKNTTPASKINPVGTYLASDRGISWETQKLFRIGQGAVKEGVNQDGKAYSIKGPWIIFPYFEPEASDKVANLKWLHVERKDGKKRTMQEANARPTLFGWHTIPTDAREVTICEGECFPGWVEVLTADGWVPFDRYEHTGGAPVAQWTREGEIEFVSPIARIEKDYSGDLLRYKTRGFTSITTPDHNMISIDYKGRYYKHTAKEGARCAQHFIPRTGICDGVGLGLSGDQLKLAIAVSADASIRDLKNTGPHKGREKRYAVFGLKKIRKIVRLRNLLWRCGIKSSDNQKANGYTWICFSLPDWIPGRLLPWHWVARASAQERELILKELVKWDGNSVPNRNQHEYATKYQHNAEWVQALAHLSGRCSSIIKRKNNYGSWLKVSILHGKQTTTWQSLRGRAERVPHADKVYCLQVPSGALVVRQEGQVSISGNCDAMTIHQWGFPCLSVPMGAGSGAKQSGWIETEWEYLLRFDTIYLCFDQDEASKGTSAEIAQRLGTHRCRIVELPHKDPNECLVKYAMTADQIYPYWRDARYLEPEELMAASVFESAVVDTFYPPDNQPAGLGLAWRGLNNLRLRFGELTVVTGINSHGKSLILGQIVAHQCDDGTRCCIASLEMAAAETLARMVKQIAGTGHPALEYIRTIMRWFDGRLWVYDVVGKTDIDRLEEMMRYARRRYNVRLFVIDSLMRCSVPFDDYEAQATFVDRLLTLARVEQCHVMLVAHPSKPKDETRPLGRLAVRGAGEIISLAHNVMEVWRNKGKERRIEELNRDAALADDEREKKLDTLYRKPDTKVVVDKQRTVSWEGSVPMWFEPESLRWRDARLGEAPKFRTVPSPQETDPFDLSQDLT